MSTSENNSVYHFSSACANVYLIGGPANRFRLRLTTISAMNFAARKRDRWGNSQRPPTIFIVSLFHSSSYRRSLCYLVAFAWRRKRQIKSNHESSANLTYLNYRSIYLVLGPPFSEHERVLLHRVAFTYQRVGLHLTTRIIR